jgi:plasmid stability protein
LRLRATTIEEILITDIDDAVIARLEARAAREGKSLEEFVREILTKAVKPNRAEIGPVALDATDLICEDRDG